MKITYRVPTNEPYAYIEVEQTAMMGPVPPSEIVDEYNSLRDAFKVGEGLPKKEYDEFIDRVMMGGTNHISQLEKCSQEQKDGYQLIKRSQARIKRLMERQSEALDYPN